MARAPDPEILRTAQDWLTDWRRQRPVLGALLAGSHVTGQPGPRSDLDIQVLLAPDTTWRERGNALRDGFLVEYFASPAIELRRQLAAEHGQGRRSLATMLATGHLLADDASGSLAALQTTARRWRRRPLPRPSGSDAAQLRYRVWDLRDNLRDVAERGASDLAFVAHTTLAALQQVYARWLRMAQLRPDQQDRILGEAAIRARYGLPDFPDPAFVRRFRRALRCAEPRSLARRAAALCDHVLTAIGPFAIDGWRNRLAVEPVHPCLAAWSEDHVIATERLVIRPTDPRQARLVNEAVHESAEALQPWMPWATPLPKRADTRRFAAQGQAAFAERRDAPQALWRIGDGRFIGNAGLHPRNQQVGALEIGYWCRSSATGQGYITEAVRALAAVAIHHLGCHRLVIRCDARNARSAAVARRAGFALEGTLRNELPDVDGTPRDCLQFVLCPGDAAVPAAELVRFGPT